jgi:4a-hydroxytetrahydrobiopterin dehydratase
MRRKKLSDDKIQARLESVPEWSLVDGHLRREFETGSFVDGVSLIIRVCTVAEEMNHHPNVHLTYPKVTLELWTHDVDGITDSDFALAEKIDGI